MFKDYFIHDLSKNANFDAESSIRSKVNKSVQVQLPNRNFYLKFMRKVCVDCVNNLQKTGNIGDLKCSNE
jgi:hypothetical protein